MPNMCRIDMNMKIGAIENNVDRYNWALVTLTTPATLITLQNNTARLPNEKEVDGAAQGVAASFAVQS
ncbi:hypothetical protein KIN20_019518 [Parelaphostrongylus tenuis]|uniref:Uncharacterized protein n=1 Tax=Parelaphostrongylus tenuis TaxID=148309 RepID=A0AAD5ML57_PARTN|nr:hypothetical protein KIN20_019518 [Parelaphostrongylus tenuis]